MPQAIGRPYITDQDEIVGFALDILRSGRSPLTIRLLAKELGVGTGLIYNYFPSKDHLLNAVAERALSELWCACDSAKNWELTLRQWMHNFYDALLESPDLARVLELAANTPAAISKQMELSRLLMRAGLTKAKSQHQAESLIETVIAAASYHGAIVIQLSGRRPKKSKALIGERQSKWKATVERNIAGIKGL